MQNKAGPCTLIRWFAATPFTTLIVFALPLAHCWRVNRLDTSSGKGCDDSSVSDRPRRPQGWRAVLLATASNQVRLLLRPNCLNLSLATGWILALLGVESEVRVGVHVVDGRFHSHAWLFANEQKICGGAHSGQYRLVWVLNIT